jgi:two-component system chemotaxis response regulator CheB
MPKKIRVLVVDDSAFMRKMLTEIINSDSQCQVIKTAKDGLECLKLIEELKPDVVTLDIELPEIDGLTCVAYIMEEYPTPVVVVTGFSEFLGDETIRALEYGAIGLVRKPKGLISANLREIKKELLSQIKLAKQVDMRKIKPVALKKAREKIKIQTPRAASRIVAIASSSGGPRALYEIVPKLPASLPGAVLIVQHMPAEFISLFAERLDTQSDIKVKVAEDSEPLQQGKVLIAPTNFLCRIEPRNNQEETIRLLPYPRKENHFFNQANDAMTSLAPIYGRNATGVVITGIGNDGTEGLRAIKKYGGYTLAEDESTCVVFGMPQAAIKAGVVDKAVPLHKIADEITKSVQKLSRNKE